MTMFSPKTRIIGFALAILVVAIVGILLVSEGIRRHPSGQEVAPLSDQIQEGSPIQDEPAPSPQTPVAAGQIDEQSSILAEKLYDTTVEEISYSLDVVRLPIKMRIDAQVEILKKESLEESLSMLSEIEMYYWPGAMGSGMMFTGMTFTGKDDMHKVMSNRRFLKVFYELSILPKERAEVLLRREIEGALIEYKALLKDYLTEFSHYFAPGAKPVGGPSFRIGNNPDNTPTFLGARFKLFALVLIAGNLRLQGLQPVIDVVLQQAQQEKRFYNNVDQVNERAAWGMLGRGSLYNRQILMTALVGTAIDLDKANTFCEDLGIKWKTKKLTRYNAAATPYDLLTRGGGPFPVDFSQGEIVVRYFDSLTDAELDKIVGELEGSGTNGASLRD